MNSFSSEAGSTSQPATGDGTLLRMGSIVLETLKRLLSGSQLGGWFVWHQRLVLGKMKLELKPGVQ